MLATECALNIFEPRHRLAGPLVEDDVVDEYREARIATLRPL
ncbi:hypothetical protein ABHV46_04800 [Asaia sp. BMEF1]